MRLVRRTRGVKLDRAEQAIRFSRDEKHGVLMRARERLSPPVARHLDRERGHEAHRRAAGHDVDEKLREGFDVRIGRRATELLNHDGILPPIARRDSNHLEYTPGILDASPAAPEE